MRRFWDFLKDCFLSTNLDRITGEVVNQVQAYRPDDSEPDDEQTYQTMDLNLFETMVAQAHWAEGERHNGAELVVETFEEGGKTYHGYMCFHEPESYDYVMGYFQAAHALKNQELREQMQIAEADLKMFDAGLVNESYGIRRAA